MLSEDFKNDGFVKLWRKSLDSRIWQNSGLWHVWCWCLIKAAHKEKWVSMSTGKGDTEVHVMPGQFIFGRKTAAKELRMKPSTIRNRMEKLKKCQNLDIQPDTHWSVVTILKWEAYQCQENKEDTQTDIQRTGKGQPKDTNKNVKNVKNIIDRPFLDEVLIFLNERLGTKYRACSATAKLVSARKREGYSLEDFKTVIRKKAIEWKGTEYETYLRPSTLFAQAHFDDYLNQNSPAQQKITFQPIDMSELVRPKV